MQLETIMLSEISQTEKDMYHMISLNMRNLKKKKQINGQTNIIKQNYRYKEQSGICQRGRGGKK